MPCLILFLTVLALNLAGDRIREYFDIKDND
jgi:ABC-type dipeptide/oligopeptide/nickel transport system permease subunit